MESRIVGFHQDAEQDWVAELDCGHFQHTRHRPPWTNRPWVLTAAGRAEQLGARLHCNKCDTGAAPDQRPPEQEQHRMDYLLFYDFVPDYLSRRAAFRKEHLAQAWAAQQRGELLLAGALANPADGALLHFRTGDMAVVEAFARGDPYVVNGLVTRWTIREWTTVVGDCASTPVRADSL